MRKGSYNGSDTQRIANRTITVASNFRFQNLQRLNTIVGEVSERNNKEISMRADKADMSDKVLDLIKNRIKTNCDRLYENYDQNKKTILKQIQQVETNMLSQNAINKGFQNVIKQKSNFDKAKSQLQQKQKKLKKLNEIKEQLKGNTTENKQLTQIMEEKCQLIEGMEAYIQSLDYQTAVLNNIKCDRRTVKLFLKQKYDRMLADEQFKKQRSKKLQTINHNKRANLKRIEEQLRKEQHCQLPQNMAGQLERKLQQYQGKHIYQNIIKHQNIISEDLRRKTEMQQIKQREEFKKIKLLKQKEDQKEYELAYNFYLIKQQQEEKIKKICGVSSLSEIVNNSLQADSENLQTIKRQTQSAIDQIKQQNQLIKKEIQSILTGKQQYTQDDLLNVQRQYVQTQKELNSIEINSQKKYALLNQWHGLVQMMTRKEVPKFQLGEILKEILDSIANTQSTPNRLKFSLEDYDKQSQNERISSKFKKMREEYQSECSVLDKSMI